MTPCALRFTPVFDKDVPSPLSLFNYTIDWILSQPLQGHLGVQGGANVPVSDLVHADAMVMRDVVSTSNR